MTYPAFIFAVLALLLAPGPTNTLILLAGVRGGLGAVVQLLPAELLGYLTAVLPLTWAGAEMLGRVPIAAVALKLVAAAWVMLLGIRLWGMPATADVDTGITPRRVYITTVLNPKALILGLVLLPAPVDGDFVPKFGVFCATVASVALIWGSVGALLPTADGDRSRLRLVQRIASAWLAVVSLTLIAGVIRA